MALLVTLGGGAGGLRCWECDSDDHDCQDPSHHTAKQCEDQSVCLRLQLEGEVTLDCHPAEEEVNVCRSLPSGDNSVQCYCQSDLCNTGTSPHLSLSLLVLLSLVLLSCHSQ